MPRRVLSLLVVLLAAFPAAAVAAAPQPAFDAALAGRLQARLGWLAAALPGRIPGGTDQHGRVFSSDFWTRGFWAGAWWQASALSGDDSAVAQALAATRRLDGGEHVPTHDLGFVYGRSDAAGYDQLCRRSAPRPAACAQLRTHALRAAGTLLDLAAFNRRAGTIPIGRGCRCRRGQTDTIIDSMSNLPLLTFAWRVTGRDTYRKVAVRHALEVARRLVRRDGSTAQSAHADRRTGRLVRVHTHQGLSARSAWARGQAWALYGFARVGAELGDRRLTAVARRVATFWRARVADGSLPRWDLDAKAGPSDTSAAAVAAAALGWLARTDPAGPWTGSGRALLTALGSRVGPDGRLAGQVLFYRQHRYGDDAELLLGVDYTLEALRLLA